LAEMAGFEPADPFQDHFLSREARSTTLTHFQINKDIVTPSFTYFLGKVSIMGSVN
jgi:hypothetical protein